MKKQHIITIVLFFISLVLFPQSGAKWSAGGNSISTGDFLGTTNNEPLILKSNSTTGLTIKTNGGVNIKSFDIGSSTLNGLVLTDGFGTISRLNFNTSPNQVLYSNGTWGALPTATATSSIWLQAGNNAYTLGKVGIGTLTPAEKLHVAGHSQIDSILNMGRVHLHVLDITNYATPTIGYKIATKIPVSATFAGMYALKFTGYAYGVTKPIDFSMLSVLDFMKDCLDSSFKVSLMPASIAAETSRISLIKVTVRPGQGNSSSPFRDQ